MSGGNDFTVSLCGKRGVKASVFFLFQQYNFNNRGSLTFEPLTLVPIQTKMIDVDSLTDKEVMRVAWRRQSGTGVVSGLCHMGGNHSLALGHVCVCIHNITS